MESPFLTLPRILGGSSHKKGMPGFIKDVTLYSAESHIGMKMDDLSFVNKVSAMTHPIYLSIGRFIFSKVVRII